jgi:hypothetical protein
MARRRETLELPEEGEEDNYYDDDYTAPSVDDNDTHSKVRFLTMAKIHVAGPLSSSSPT